MREYNAMHYVEHFEKHQEHSRLYHMEHPEKARERGRRYETKHREKRRESSNRYHHEHREEINKRRRGYSKDPKVRVNNATRCMIWYSLKGNKNKHHWEDLVGYSLAELMEHLEPQFQKGMTWENYGKWHVDHIRPIADFNFTSPDDPEFKACWSLWNLQPLWAKENQRKGTKLVQQA